MALSKGRAAFKKKDGILAVTDDQAAITWTPLPGTGQPTVSLSIANITSEPAFVPSTHLCSQGPYQLTCNTRSATDPRHEPQGHAKDL